MERNEKMEKIRHIINGDCLTPVSSFLRMTGQQKCLLESIPRDKESERYSIIAFDPVLELSYENGQFSRKDLLSEKIETYSCQDPLKELEKYILKDDAVSLTNALPFSSGGIGYVGYDIATCYEDIGKIPRDEFEIPDLLFLVFESFLVFDHQKEIVTLNLENTYSQRSTTEMTLIKNRLLAEIKQPREEEQLSLQQEELNFNSHFTQTEFENIVRTAKKKIYEGDLFQVVPSQRLKAKFTQDPFDYYRKLRLSNPSAYLYYLDFGGTFKVIGSSPESLVRVKGNQVTTNPIAGTRKRGATSLEDLQLADELLHDPKEIAEHQMLIDLGRNDLGKITETGSITVPVYMVIEKYRYVMHIVSVVEGVKKTGITSMDALKATLPAGTVSGAPKIRAMKRIYEWEPVKRSVYAGAVGYLSKDDQSDFAIGIRTLVYRNGFGYVQAGAGVVYDSDPTAEYFETLQKAKALLEVGKYDLNR